jgi:hypothetical protein
MKKNLVLITVAGVLVLALGAAGFAYAQDEEPTEPEGGFPFMAARWFGARGFMVPGSAASCGRGFQRIGGEGFATRDVSLERMASEMGISVEELESRIEAGILSLRLLKPKELTWQLCVLRKVEGSLSSSIWSPMSSTPAWEPVRLSSELPLVRVSTCVKSSHL